MAEIGSTLREARMRARIDISEVEARTKIRAKYLRAIENEEWDLLPGTVYIRSFLKTYGDYLGLDSRPLIDEFKRRYESPGDQERTLAAIQRDRADRGTGGSGGSRGSGRGGSGGRPTRAPRRRFRFGPEAALVVVIIAIVVVLIALHNHHKTSGPGTGSSITPASAGHQHKKHDHEHHNKTSKTTKTNTTPTKPTQASLALVPTSATGVWVCVEGPDNKVLVPGAIYTSGEKVPTAKGSELFVSLGNSDITAKVNGKSYPISASASAIAFKVTTSGAHTLSTGPTCSS